MSPAATSLRSTRSLPGGETAVGWRIAIVLLAAVATLEGCSLARPKTIAVRDDTVPRIINRGEPAPYDGVLLSRPLFNEVAPCLLIPESE